MSSTLRLDIEQDRVGWNVEVHDSVSTAEAWLSVSRDDRTWQTGGANGHVAITEGSELRYRIMLHGLYKNNSTERGIGRRMLCTAIRGIRRIPWANVSPETRVVLEASGRVRGSYAALIGLYRTFGFQPFAALWEADTPDRTEIERAFHGLLSVRGPSDDDLEGILTVTMYASLRDILVACERFPEPGITEARPGKRGRSPVKEEESRPQVRRRTQKDDDSSESSDSSSDTSSKSSESS